MTHWTITQIGTLDEVAFRADLPRSTGNFSLTLWFYATRSDQRQILAKLGEPYGDGWLLVIEDYRLWVETEINGQTRIVAAADIQVGKWQAVALVVDREQESIALWLDIRHGDRRWLPHELPASFEQIVIGGYTDPAGGHYDYTFGRRQSGWADDVRFFERVLSVEEILELCSSPAGKPVAAFEIVPHAPHAPQSVQFDASASYLPDGTIQACLWDFGDGTTAFGTQVEHVYPYAGEYPVRLTVIGANHHQTVLERLLTVSGAANPLQVSPVFENGTEGYACFRIPAIVRAANGDLLAFAEGRVESCSDSTDTIHIVCKRSSDQGRTWSALQVVGRNMMGEREGVVNNCAAVVDHVRGTGKIIVLYNKAQHSEWDLAAGTGTSRIFAIFSDDHGQTWHSETDISPQVQQLEATEDRPIWRVQRPTLGHALQMPDGRMVFSGMFTAGEHGVFESQNYLFWTDDLGDSWQRGAGAPHIGLNEASAVDLEDGRVLINSRAYIDGQRAGCRAQTIATFAADGTVSYAPSVMERTLVCSAVQGSIQRYSYSHDSTKGNRSRLLFSNPAHPFARYQLTVRLSYDEGQTWAVSKLIDGGQAAYSDLVVQSDGRIGVLYERGNHGGLVYVHFSLDWLTDGQDTGGESA